MSYIGRLPIKIPNKVCISITEGNKTLTVKGPHGQHSISEINGISYNVNPDGNEVYVDLEEAQYKSGWGLARSLLANKITGVSRGFTRKLQLVGVGYRAAVIDNKVLELKLGFSHDILLDIPQGISVTFPQKSSIKTLIVLSGNDKDFLSKFAFKIRNFRPPEPYKGKGVTFVNESVRRKEGKKK
tara:strand:+ start:5716 stop:6270 length:555 start_codon:yes stop_codon:yes gene_type:complete